MAESFFDRIHKQDAHTPDVLSCLANLSNDEVFTPPEVVNQMLDMLPQELFESRETTFLDPACKTGVFLREIAKRLLNARLPLYKDKMALINEKKALNIELTYEDEVFLNDLQSEIDHIFHKQLFGIAITELTSLLSRRSVYCSKYPNGPYSITKFDNSEGNIRFKKVEHTWKNDRCVFCGASKIWDRGKSLETHAYELIHRVKPEEIFNMKFDVIISNPPYQLSDGGAQASAMPIYHHFIKSAIKLDPRYITMITPSRWFAGGKNLNDFRNEMLHDNRLKEINDYPNASECFPGVEIKGGINYFLWDRSYSGDCTIKTYVDGKVVSSANRPLLEDECDVFIRNNELVSIFKKVREKKEDSFMKMVSSMKPFGIRGDFFKNPSKYDLPSVKTEKSDGDITIYGLENNKRVERYVSANYPLPKTDYLDKYKMFMPRNQGSGILGETFSKPVFAKPNQACTETFVVIGLFDTEEEMNNCWSYIKTKFFRAMIGVRKVDQGMSQNVYSFVPMQDFSKSWTDEELYAKYKLTQEEIDFIETMIKPMDLDGE